MSAGTGSTNPGLPEWAKTGGTLGTGALGVAVGGDQVRRHLAQEKSARLQRDMERVKDLNTGKLSPPQFAFYCGRDDIPRSHIEANLTLWGGTHEGHDYSIPDSFGLEPIEITSPSWFKRRFNWKDRNYRLNLFPPNQSRYKGRKSEGRLSMGITGSGPSDNPLRRGGGRGRYNSPAEPQIQLENGREMTAQEYQYYDDMSDNMSSKKSQWSPNPSYEISEQYPRKSEEYLQDSQGRVVARSYLLPIHDENPDLFFWVFPGVVVVALAGYFTFNFVSKEVQRKFTEWIASEESQRFISVLQKAGLFKNFKRPQGEDQELEAGEGSQRPASSLKEAAALFEEIDRLRRKINDETSEELKRLRGGRLERVRPEFLLEIFTRYKRGTITKGAATRVLMNCYHLSEAEALEWLDKE